MAADSRVIFSTELDESGLKKGLSDLKGGIGGLAVGVGTALGSIGATMLSSVVSGLVENTQHYIDVASSLNEVQNVVDTTFGSSAETVNNFAVAAKEAYGMSELKAKQFTSTMGAMLKSMGMTETQTLDMSTSMTGLAGDMASFYNLDYDTAFEKLRSGISGETEPLKQLGINMSVANLEAYALAQGMTTSYSKMTQAQQATLRYSYLMSVTADAQGDFARTSEGYANQQRILATTQEELAATIGEILLPIALEWTKTLNTMVGGIRDAVEWVGELFNPPQNELQQQIAASTKAVDSYSSAVESAGANLDTSLAQTQAAQSMATSLLRNYSQILSKNELTAEDTAQLRTIAQQIIDIYPSMADTIDSTTGLFNTNTGAIQTNIDTLAEQSKAMAYYASTQEYQNALLSAQVTEHNALESLKATWSEWQQEATKLSAANSLMDILYGNWDSAPQYAAQLISMDSAWKQFFTDMGNGNYVLSETAKQTDFASNMMMLLETDITNLDVATSSLNDQTNVLTKAYNTATEATTEASDGLQTAQEYAIKNGDAWGYVVEQTDAATTANEEYTDSSGQVVASVEEESAELKSLRDTMKGISNDTLKQIDSQIDGFEKIKKVRPSSAKSSIDALKSQQKYLEDYKKNLELAKTMGYSEEVITALSDGSTDSASKLAGLVKANETQITQVNDLYAGVTAQKTELADTLTQNNTEYQTAQSLLEAAMAADVTDTTTAATTLSTTASTTAQSTQADATAAGQASADVATAKTQTASGAQAVETTVKDMVDSVGTTVEDGKDDITDAGSLLLEYFADGVDGSSDLTTALTNAVKNAGSKVKSTASTKTYSIGGAMTSGIAQGIKDHASSVQAALQKVIDDAIKAIKRSLGIASPSTVMRDLIGVNMADGVSAGFVGQISNSSGIMSAAILDSVMNASKAIDSTLLSKVSALPEFSVSAESVSASATGGTTYGLTSSGGGATDTASREGIQNTYNFYQPITTPDETARAIRRQNTYGLAGARA